MPLPSAGSEPDAWLALDLIPGLGAESLRVLLGTFESPRNVLEQPVRSLAKIVPATLARAIAAGPDAAALAAGLRWLEAADNHLVTFADADYPALLLQIADPPPTLYLKGRRELLGNPGLAVVGSRNATPQGIANAEAFARALADAGLTIVSGLALGIDSAAHRGGLAGAASSIAVVGTGLDLIYPPRNKSLAQELARNGALVSEFPLGMPALPANFPRRNRIISGMSRGCLVVEAALASGSLITARLAAEQGREVFAIPGSIHSPFSKGCHRLIKQGAKLVESAQDVIEELGLAGSSRPVAPADATEAPPLGLDPLLDRVGFDPVGFDALIERTGLGPDALGARLVEWELAGVVATLPGGKYQRVR